MTTTLAEQVAADLAATAFDTTAELSPAESATYTPLGGSGSAVSMIFVDDSERKADYPDGQIIGREMVALVQAADVAAPAIHDTITRGEETWTVAAIRDLGLRQMWELTLHRSETAEKSRGGFRRPR